MHILYTWLREVFQIGGYSYDERSYMLKYIMFELEIISVKNPKLREVSSYLIINQSGLLQFIKDVNIKMKDFAKKEKIDLSSLSLM